MMAYYRKLIKKKQRADANESILEQQSAVSEPHSEDFKISTPLKQSEEIEKTEEDVDVSEQENEAQKTQNDAEEEGEDEEEDNDYGDFDDFE